MFDVVRIPKNSWMDRLSLIQEGEHRELILDWFEEIPNKISTGKGLYLHGDFGVGKSSIAAILLKGALAFGIFGLWVNFKPLPQYYKSPDKHMFDDQISMFQRILQVPILVIDEFTVGVKDWWPLEIFEEIIRCRVQKKLSTVITSNHSPNFFTDGLLVRPKPSPDEKKIAAMSQGLVSILKEAVDSIHVTGESYRK
jgi:primosomal protein DnaI